MCSRHCGCRASKDCLDSPRTAEVFCGTRRKATAVRSQYARSLHGHVGSGEACTVHEHTSSGYRKTGETCRYATNDEHLQTSSRHASLTTTAKVDLEHCCDSTRDWWANAKSPRHQSCTMTRGIVPRKMPRFEPPRERLPVGYKRIIDCSLFVLIETHVFVPW